MNIATSCKRSEGIGLRRVNIALGAAAMTFQPTLDLCSLSLVGFRSGSESLELHPLTKGILLNIPLKKVGQDELALPFF